MARISFRIPSVLNQGQGEKKLEMDADDVASAFAAASDIMGDDFKRRALEPDGSPRQLINIYVNGKNAQFTGGIKTALADGDDIYILPAIAGGEELSETSLDRYSRQVMLESIGYAGQLALGRARVCIVGAGGLGNPIASRLAAMGTGHLRLVDRDVIELSNLHRQTLFDESDIGRIKVEAAKEKLGRMNSEIEIEAVSASVNEYNAAELIHGCDVVIDALDSVSARYALNAACVDSGIPFVTGAAVGVTGQAFTIVPKESACYYCVFPQLDEDSMPTCSIEGVDPPILSIIGAVEVSEAVRVILGRRPVLSEKILHVDLDTLAFQTSSTMRVPECPVCGSGKITREPKKELIIEELCGRNRGKRTFSLTPTDRIAVDAKALTAAAMSDGFLVENQGDLGVSLRNADYAINVMRGGSAVIVGAPDEAAAVLLYRKLLPKIPAAGA